jgi:hypothetical protein
MAITDLLQIQAWLAEARLAKHQILTSQKAVELSQSNGAASGKAVYHAVDIDALSAWILELEFDLSRLTRDPQTRRRALYLA